MPAVNPRVYVSFQPETHRAISRIATGTGKSMSAVIGELIEEQSPMLQQIADAITDARALKLPVSGSMGVKLSFRGKEVELAATDAQSALDRLLEDLREERVRQAAGAGDAS